MNLHEWQIATHKAIREGGGGELFKESRAQHVAVYRRAFRLRVAESLREDFPLTERLLGKAAFTQAVESFLASPIPHRNELGALSPLFAEHISKMAVTSSVVRSLALDLLALESLRAPDVGGDGMLFGLHPSVRLLEMDSRCYAIWREDGVVRRERLRKIDLNLLGCFLVKAEVLELSMRLEALGLKPKFVQESVALWTRLELIVNYAV